MSPRDKFYIYVGLLFLGLLIGEIWIFLLPIFRDTRLSLLERAGLCTYPLVVWILCVFMNYLQWVGGRMKAGGGR